MKTKQKKTSQKREGKARECNDPNCPVHGSIRLRGRRFTGRVISDKMRRTVIVSWIRRAFVKKYERYEKRVSKVTAHNPDCIGAQKGDRVRIVETRPLSKTKHFVVKEVLGRETKKQTLKQEAIEQTKEEYEKPEEKQEEQAEEAKSKQQEAKKEKETREQDKKKSQEKTKETGTETNKEKNIKKGDKDK